MNVTEEQHAGVLVRDLTFLFWLGIICLVSVCQSLFPSWHNLYQYLLPPGPVIHFHFLLFFLLLLIKLNTKYRIKKKPKRKKKMNRDQIQPIEHACVDSESRPDGEASSLRRRQFPCHCAKAMPISLNNHGLPLTTLLSLFPPFCLDLYCCHVQGWTV